MSTNKNIGFEQQIKDALENYEVAYNPTEWINLEKKLNKASFKLKLMKAAGIALVIVTVALVAIWVKTPRKADISITKSSHKQNSIQQKTKSSTTISDNADVNKKDKDFVSELQNLGIDQSNNNNDEQPGGYKQDKSAIIPDNTDNQNKPDQELKNELDKKSDDASLILENNQNEDNEHQKTARVLNPGFKLSSNEVCLDEEIEFTVFQVEKGYIYHWDFGDGSFSDKITPKHRYSLAGSFEVRLNIKTDLQGQKHTASSVRNVTVYPVPTADFTYKPDDSHNYLIDPKMKFINLSEGADSWVWDFNNEMKSDEKSPEYAFRKRGRYMVSLTATNQFGCSSSKSTEVEVIEDYNLLAPNGFSPNGDGLNDTWIPYALKYSDVKFTLQILDPITTTLIFECSDSGNEWDGRIKGNGIAKPGQVFVWIAVVEKQDGSDQKYTGTITIIK